MCAMLLAVIYITAGLFSSLSVLMCDKHHGHVEKLCCHDEACSCANLAFTQDCCGHHHPILEDNQSFCATNVQRGDVRLLAAMAMALSSAVVITADSECESNVMTIYARGSGDESTPLRAAYISTRALRAPPVLA